MSNKIFCLNLEVLFTVICLIWLADHLIMKALSLNFCLSDFTAHKTAWSSKIEKTKKIFTRAQSKVALAALHSGLHSKLTVRAGTVKEMDETPKKMCNRKVKICRCSNSHLSNVYDSIDLFGKRAQIENVIEKLKELGKIEVQESDQDLLTTKICSKSFQKVTGLAKAMDEFRNNCSQSKKSIYRIWITLALNVAESLQHQHKNPMANESLQFPLNGTLKPWLQPIKPLRKSAALS